MHHHYFFSILDSENVANQSVEALASQLGVFNKQEYFKGNLCSNWMPAIFQIKKLLQLILTELNILVGNALVMLLQNADLLPSPSQRLAAVLLLHELFKPDSQNFHPFSSIFVQILVSSKKNINLVHNEPIINFSRQMILSRSKSQADYYPNLVYLKKFIYLISLQILRKT